MIFFVTNVTQKTWNLYIVKEQTMSVGGTASHIFVVIGIENLRKYRFYKSITLMLFL
jgi:hypothetical protein